MHSNASGTGTGTEKSSSPIKSVNNSNNFVDQSSLVSQKSKVIPLRVKGHQRGKRNSLKLFSKNFCWIGNNIAGPNLNGLLFKSGLG